jgi:D-alanine-D-alanine ligase
VELKGEPGHTSDPLLRPALRRRAHRVLVAHNPVADGDDPSTSDVLAQVELVEAALAGLAVPARRLPVTNWRIWEDLAAAASPRDLATGTVVFNLVEAPPGQPALHPATAGALELLGLPFSGSSAAALWLTTDKLATRAILAASGLPVAPGGRLDRGNAEVLERVPPPWILKPSCEDASLGLDGDAVCATRAAACARAAELEQRFPGQPILVERYLSGRELNISLLANGGQPLVLPVAEIAFLDFPPGMPRIVGYEAKWQPDSFAYTHTVRRFPSDPASAAVIEQASRLALAAWSACGLEGYARVDIRLDEHGAPHILEVNANPCLAADAGFMAAATQAGLTPRAVVASILAAALERHRAAATPRSAAPAAAIATVAKSDDAFAESARRKPAQVRAMA